MPDNNSSAQVVSEAPEEAIPYEDFYNARMLEWHPNWTSKNIPIYGSVSYKIAKAISMDQNRAESMYQTYLDNLHARNEAKATQSARAFDEYMSSTAYSRTFKDLENAGINPYMLLQSGSVSPGSVGSSAKSSYGARKTGLKETESNVKGRDIALILLAIARLMAMQKKMFS